MRIKRYQTMRFSYFVRAVKVDKETDKSVWINGRRCATRGRYSNYYKTFKEAHDALLEKAQSNVDGCIKALNRAETYLHKVQANTTPYRLE